METNFCDNANAEAIATEHQLHYNIYYNELQIYYVKMTICITIQLALFTGLLLKFNSFKSNHFIMIACLLFLLPFSMLELLIAVRGYISNNSVIAAIQEFETANGFRFLNKFEQEVHKHKQLTRMNFPSFAMCIISALFLVLWLYIFVAYAVVNLKGFFSTQLIQHVFNCDYIKILLAGVIGSLLAITMKIADMIDEHGLIMFKHADMLFGVLWGVCGAILVIVDVIIANAIFAMMIGYVFRSRLDNRNHIMAFLIVVVSFILFSSIRKRVLLCFIVSFIILGSIKDLKYLKKQDKLSRFVQNTYLYVPIIYAIPGLLYSIFFGNWSVFASLFMFDLTYNIVRLISKHKEWYID